MRRTLALLLLCAASGTGCTTEFDPVQPSDRYFSVSGYLDAAADTQWVRVEAVGRTFDPLPGLLDARVTLRDEGTGEEVVLDQVIRETLTGSAHLFWTTAPVRPASVYRLAARNAEGAETRVQIAVPEASFLVIVDSGPFTCPTRVVVRRAERVVDVQSVYRVQTETGRERTYRFSKVPSFEYASDGAVFASIYFDEDAVRMGLRMPGSTNTLLSSEVRVAVGTDDWPVTAGLTIETALLVADSPLVEGGVGFLGGVVTRTEPFSTPAEFCARPNRAADERGGGVEARSLRPPETPNE